MKTAIAEGDGGLAVAEKPEVALDAVEIGTVRWTPEMGPEPTISREERYAKDIENEQKLRTLDHLSPAHPAFPSHW